MIYFFFFTFTFSFILFFCKAQLNNFIDWIVWRYINNNYYYLIYVENGLCFSKVQARFAFATYLMRVQHRLEAQTGSHDADDDNASDEQMVST